MKNYQYKCTLLTDVIITAMAATEGYKESLDYIPGSKFLGIVAGQLYDEQNEQKTLDLFHNGKIRFSDATIMLNGEALNKVPFSWFHNKGGNLTSEIYIHHLISGDDLKDSKTQLKQVRSGYFSSDQKKFVTIEQDFSLKSAHDNENRKSKDGQMYGYFSLKSGSTWVFNVEDENDKYADEIKTVLEGKHRIGRSRTAEFGLVEISFLYECKEPNETAINDEAVIYAQSNLCFYNKHGQTTAIPTAQQLVGSEDAIILWEKCQIRSRNYKTWNRHRYNKDTDRIIIERGSVFVVKLNTVISSNYFVNGIGSHKSEGLGRVLINPAFLQSDNKTLPFILAKSHINYQQNFSVVKGINDNEILNSISYRRNRNDFAINIDKTANAFKKEYEKIFKGISKSQWGTLRNYGKYMPDKEAFDTIVFDETSGLLFKGQSENVWRANDRRDILKKHLDHLDKKIEYLPYIVKLSNLMGKNNTNEIHL